MAENSQFKLMKILNYGSSHPVVARILLQTHDLLRWADLSDEERNLVVAVYDRLKDRLLKCHEAFNRLCKALNKTIEECEFQKDGSSKFAPYVMGLDGEVETILYEAKNYLRDLLRILKIYFNYECNEAAYLYDPKSKGTSPLVEWATERFGKDDPFTKMLATEQEWIEYFIRRRNAVEHPAGHSGTLHIHNFLQCKDGRYVLPTWNLDDNEPKGIYPDIEVILENLLTLAEEFLVLCNVHRTKFKIIQYIEIPEDMRKPECPKRFTVQLKDAIGLTKTDPYTVEHLR